MPGEVGMDGLERRDLTAPATQGLAIGNWRHRKRARTKTLTPVNAHADRELACPACRTTLSFMGDRWGCAGCRGTFVENAALVDMVSDIAKTPWALPPATGSIADRACPICAAGMTVESMQPSQIDRCAEHGVWFDAGELSAALEDASGAFEPGLRAWLRRLFT